MDGGDDTGALRALDDVASLTAQVNFLQTQWHHMVGDVAVRCNQVSE